MQFYLEACKIKALPFVYADTECPEQPIRAFTDHNRVLNKWVPWSDSSVCVVYKMNPIKVNVLKFQALVACQKGIHKQSRPRPDLIKVFPVCYFDRHC